MRVAPQRRLDRLAQQVEAALVVPVRVQHEGGVGGHQRGPGAAHGDRPPRQRLDGGLGAQQEALQPLHQRRRRSRRRCRAGRRRRARRVTRPKTSTLPVGCSRNVHADAAHRQRARRPATAGPGGRSRRRARRPARRRAAPRTTPCLGRSSATGCSWVQPLLRHAARRRHGGEQGGRLVAALEVLELRVASRPRCRRRPAPTRPAGPITIVRMAMAVSMLPEKSR